ncbi:hypothetical protein [Clostridium sp. DL1XJH146]
MNRVKGALRLYKESEAIWVILIASLGMIYSIIMPKPIENGEYNSLYIIAFFVYIAVVIFKTCLSFKERYIMLSQFNSSRKIFYKVSMLAVVIEATIFSTFTMGFLFIENIFSFFNKVDFIVEFFGVKYVNPGIQRYIILLLMIFLAIIFTYSFCMMVLSFMNLSEGSIVIGTPTIAVIFLLIVPEAARNCGSFFRVSIIVIVFTVINFISFWNNIKRESVL